MEKNYIFKTKDGTVEFSIRGTAGRKKMEALSEKFPDTKIQSGNLVIVIITEFEDAATLEKEVMY